jgi:hypothetical protein
VEKRRGGWSLELTEWRRLAPGQSSKMEGKMGRKGGPVRLALGEREGSHQMWQPAGTHSVGAPGEQRKTEL